MPPKVKQLGGNRIWPGGARRLVIVGAITEALYLAAVVGPFSLLSNGSRLTDLGGLTGHGWPAAVLVSVGLLVLFVLYGTAIWQLLRYPKLDSRLVLGGTILFCLTLVFLYPVTAMDIYNYAVQGHVVASYHLNPLITAPASVQGDPFISYAGIWANSASPYGPFWIAITALDAAIVGPNIIPAVLLLKMLSAVGVVATTALLKTAAEERGSRRGAVAAALFGWNPLVLIELVGNGHNDAVMIALCLFSLVLLTRHQATFGAPALAASVFVKYLTAVAVPYYFLSQIADGRRSVRTMLSAMGGSVLSFVVITAVVYAPFWAGPATFERVRQVNDNYLASLPALAILLLPNAAFELTAARLAIVGLVGIWQTWAILHRRTTVERAVFETYFAVLLVATHFAGWYLPLLIALGVLSADRWLVARAVVFSVTALLTTPLWTYLFPATQNALSFAQFHLIVVPFTFLPPLALIIVQILAARHGAAPAVPRVTRRDSKPRTPVASLS